MSPVSLAILHGSTSIDLIRPQQNIEGKSALVGLEQRSSDGFVLIPTKLLTSKSISNMSVTPLIYVASIPGDTSWLHKYRPDQTATKYWGKECVSRARKAIEWWFCVNSNKTTHLQINLKYVGNSINICRQYPWRYFMAPQASTWSDRNKILRERVR